VLTAAQVNTYLNEQTVMVFADSAARTTALSGVLAEGMMSYLQDTDSVEVYNGSAWVAVGGGGLTSPLTTKGDIWVYGTGDTRLPVGTNGHTLVADSSTATGLAYAAPAAGGGMTLLTSTQASSLSSLSFTSLGSHKQLLLVWEGIKHSDGTSRFTIRLNNDSGSNYDYAYIGSTGGATYANDSTTDGAIGVSTLSIWGVNTDSATTNRQAQGFLLLDNYTSSTRNKFFTARYSYYITSDGNVGPGLVNLSILGKYKSNTAITSIDIVRTNGSGTFSNIGDTEIKLYGIS
jgi:hypothetical protein